MSSFSKFLSLLDSIKDMHDSIHVEKGQIRQHNETLKHIIINGYFKKLSHLSFAFKNLKEKIQFLKLVSTDDNVNITTDKHYLTVSDSTFTFPLKLSDPEFLRSKFIDDDTFKKLTSSYIKDKNLILDAKIDSKKLKTLSNALLQMGVSQIKILFTPKEIEIKQSIPEVKSSTPEVNEELDVDVTNLDELLNEEFNEEESFDDMLNDSVGETEINIDAPVETTQVTPPVVNEQVTKETRYFFSVESNNRMKNQNIKGLYTQMLPNPTLKDNAYENKYGVMSSEVLSFIKNTTDDIGIKMYETSAKAKNKILMIMDLKTKKDMEEDKFQIITIIAVEKLK